MEILIDGHNLMFVAARADSRFAVERGESAREELLSALSQYQAVRGDRVVCFFDGGPGGGDLPRLAFGRGLQIVYSDPRSDADTEIKRYIARHHAPNELRVVSSDRAVSDFALKHGCQTAPSQQFFAELHGLLHSQALPEGEPPEKYEGVPDAEADFWMNVFGDDEDIENGE